MSHSFSVKLNKEISGILRAVESAITGNGGVFEGSTERGTFHVKSEAGLIKGEYSSASDDQIAITITDKPFFVPYSLIEVEIRKYFR